MHAGENSRTNLWRLTHQRAPAQSSLIFSLACNARRWGLRDKPLALSPHRRAPAQSSSSLLPVMLHAGEGLGQTFGAYPPPAYTAQSSLIFSLACIAPVRGLRTRRLCSPSTSTIFTHLLSLLVHARWGLQDKPLAPHPTSVHQHNLHSSSLLLVRRWSQDNFDAYSTSVHQHQSSSSSLLLVMRRWGLQDRLLWRLTWRTQHNLHSSSLLPVMHAGEGLRTEPLAPHPTSVHQHNLHSSSLLPMHAGEGSQDKPLAPPTSVHQHNLHSSSLACNARR
jgi:hypothetical protein